ncbi:histone deacetylase HDT1-like isoform X2 [Malania oleifera]|uniref:histone deacetylase HDT1-like isoform X2 n=1 Tax=Malania oleifera TaxID=397392 RepID=UPI0025ADED9F|nr:histone deacetylase HDT1-like isoform X2 [Malania oleifera]
MEFWGVEVKPGQPLEVNPDFTKIIHLSQAALGESKDKGKESIPLFVKIGDKKLVLGTLSPEVCPQLAFDIVFEQKFELSHNWKKGSVYFLGYEADVPAGSDYSDSESDPEEEVPLLSENGNLELKVEATKADMTKANAAKPESSEKPKVKIVDPKERKSKKDESDEDDTSDDLDEDSESDESDDEEMVDGEDSSDDNEDDDEDEDEDEDEEPPKKAGPSKKRSSDSAVKTPVPDKKAKLVSPQKTGGKKGAHTVTPHPSKQAAKTPVTNDKAKPQTPKSSGQVSCKSCSKTFNSEGALQSHSKAKHGGK